MADLLEVKKISKHFGGLKALEDVSLTIKDQQIVGLIGPNGAGKTTLFNVITGMYYPSQGDIFLRGTPVLLGKAHEIASAGIARTFQNIRLFNNLTVLENVLVGRHICSSATVLGAIFNTQATRQEEKEAKEKAQYFLNYVGLTERMHDYARILSYGAQRRLEIARALAMEPCLLALDEPAAGMNIKERTELAQLIERIREDGKAVLVIEHDVKWIMSLCHDITVLDFGKVIAQGTPQQVQNNPRVIEAYLGKGDSHVA